MIPFSAEKGTGKAGAAPHHPGQRQGSLTRNCSAPVPCAVPGHFYGEEGSGISSSTGPIPTSWSCEGGGRPGKFSRSGCVFWKSRYNKTETTLRSGRRTEKSEDKTMDYAKESLRLHGEWKGKIEVIATVPTNRQGVPVPGLHPRRGPALPGDPEGPRSKSYELHPPPQPGGCGH